MRTQAAPPARIMIGGRRGCARGRAESNEREAMKACSPCGAGPHGASRPARADPPPIASARTSSGVSRLYPLIERRDEARRPEPRLRQRWPILKGYDIAIRDYDAHRHEARLPGGAEQPCVGLSPAGVDRPGRRRKVPALSPASPHALDTRAHIRQALGPQGALHYDKAMW